MQDISFVPILVLGLVVLTLTNAVKYVTNRQWNALVTLLSGWVIGVAAVWLVGATQWGQTITVGGSQSLDHLSFVEKLLVGLVVVSTGSTIYDVKRAIDRTDSAQTPSLLPPVKTPTYTAHENVPDATVEEPTGTYAGPIQYHDVPPTGEG